ncbi:LamG-like jellyroll fold domain-containing protein [Symbioplanes lichenis]|uniref:LamG-like jellyroll fold domain-containing protein n=1 Tax=Symbioplanes lichenis TaxID=1629072 RepID=UPI002739F659|nr:LamG-like jellyroll fold domain-containing protein [Actinoplanes lichenis]
MYDTRRSWFSPFGALATIAILGITLLSAVHFAEPSDAAPRHPRPVSHEPSPRPSAGVLTSDTAAFAAQAQTSKIGTARESVSIRYTFDGGVNRPITDTHGGYLLRPHVQNGGTLSLVRQGKGLAVQYPNRCTLVRERECPRAILQGLRDDNLNPGTRPMRYGASIRMSHSDLADGANVFQKGYSVGGGSQFKLQVDHTQGHPSCVVAGRTRTIYRAEPRVDVADGKWHTLMCARSANRLSLIVDGVERAAVPVPKNLSIANAEPLRVGGKGAGKGNDQYAGQIDNVFLMIG